MAGFIDQHDKFQSPVSRGKSFHLTKAMAALEDAKSSVSIPCQSGQVIPPSERHVGQLPVRRRFQSPVSRGKSFHGKPLRLQRCPRPVGFNPLSVGASHSTESDFVGACSRSPSFNPLSVGASHSTFGPELEVAKMLVDGFNPLSVGASHSTYRAGVADPASSLGFNPLSVGASHSTALHGGSRRAWSTLVSIPCQSGQVIPRGLGCRHQTFMAEFQSPVSRGKSFHSRDRSRIS